MHIIKNNAEYFLRKKKRQKRGNGAEQKSWALCYRQFCFWGGRGVTAVLGSEGVACGAPRCYSRVPLVELAELCPVQLQPPR